jgi:hypothetical protein
MTTANELPPHRGGLSWCECEGSRTWGHAQALVDTVNSAHAGGKNNDWRLPTRAELLSLFGTDQAPYGGFFWTSEVCDTPGCAWVVDFLCGKVYQNFYRVWAYVLLVRNDPAENYIKVTYDEI